MKRIFLLLVLVASCSVAGPGRIGIPIPGTNRVLVSPTGVQLQIFNYCKQVDGIVYPSVGDSHIVPPGHPIYVYIPYTGDPAKATYTQLNNQSEVVGTLTHSLNQYFRSGVIRTVQWIIGGNSKGGGTDVIIDHIKSIC